MFICEKKFLVEEMFWWKEVWEVKDKKNFFFDEEWDMSYVGWFSLFCFEFGKVQYFEFVVFFFKRVMDNFFRGNEIVGEQFEELLWRKEVKEIRRLLSVEELLVFFFVKQLLQMEVMWICFFLLKI